MVQNGNINVIDFIGDSKPEKQYLGNGHPKKNEQRPSIPEDMVKLLFYKTYKSFHFPL
jgi:hypothetical protein